MGGSTLWPFWYLSFTREEVVGAWLMLLPRYDRSRLEGGNLPLVVLGIFHFIEPSGNNRKLNLQNPEPIVLSIHRRKSDQCVTGGGIDDRVIGGD